MQVETTAIDIGGRGIMLFGPSGSGKSDLAFRMSSHGALLIGDDAIKVMNSNGRLFGEPCDNARGQLALRGIGTINMPISRGAVPLSLAITLADKPMRELAPRLTIAGPWHGLHLPQIVLHAAEASATHKVLLALERFGL